MPTPARLACAAPLLCLALAGLTREQERYVLCRRALLLVDDADFGSCLTCKQPIGIDRLRYQPEILTCVRCA